MSSKKNRGLRPCSYCNAVVADAVNEHVLNKKLFDEKDRANLPQVPSCKACNTQKSKLEERLLYYWLLGQTDTRHSEVEQKFSRAHPEVTRIKTTAQNVMVDGCSELAIGDEGSIELIKKWSDYLVRGLHFFHFNETVTASYKSNFLTLTKNLLAPNSVSDRYVKRKFGRLHYEAQAIRPPAIGEIWKFDLFGFRFADEFGNKSETHLVFLQSETSYARGQQRVG